MSNGPVSLSDPRVRKRAWIQAGIVFSLLLIVPLLAWIVVPAAPPTLWIAAPAETFAVAPPVRSTPSIPTEAAPPPKPKPTATATAIEGGVEGAVLDPDGKPLASVFVECTDRELSTIADNDGKFHLPAEAIGCLGVAKKPGYAPSEKVTFAPGSARANTLQLKKGGVIAGTVADDRGNAIPKFTIAVEVFISLEHDDDGPSSRTRTVEDPEGKFELKNLTPGKYVLVASAAGRPPVRTEAILVEAAREVRGIRITLPAGATLSGIVTDAETRKPIAGARVSLDAYTSTGANIPSARTDDEGKYTLEGVPPGPFSIRVEHDGHRSKIVSGIETRGASEIKSDVQLATRKEGEPESELGGIGALLAPAPNGGVLIAHVVAGGPAQKAGLEKFDRVTRIEGTDVTNLTVPDCIQRLRGEPGTVVSMTYERNGATSTINIRRENVMR